MTPVFYYLLLYLCGIIVQFGWGQYLNINGLAPNFILILTIMLGLIRGSMAAQTMGFMWGLSWDIVSVGMFGSNSFTLTLVGFLSGKLSHKWDESKFESQMLIAFIGSAFYWTCLYSVYYIFSPGETALKLTAKNMVQLFVDAFAAPFVFAIEKAMFGKYRKSQF